MLDIARAGLKSRITLSQIAKKTYSTGDEAWHALDIGPTLGRHWPDIGKILLLRLLDLTLVSAKIEDKKNTAYVIALIS